MRVARSRLGCASWWPSISSCLCWRTWMPLPSVGLRLRPFAGHPRACPTILIVGRRCFKVRLSRSHAREPWGSCWQWSFAVGVVVACSGRSSSMEFGATVGRSIRPCLLRRCRGEACSEDQRGIDERSEARSRSNKRMQPAALQFSERRFVALEKSPQLMRGPLGGRLQLL